MGREWLYKAGGGGDASAGRRGKGKTSSTTSKPVNRKTKKERNNSSSGCMSAIFSFFDVQHHQFGFNYPSFISESAINNPQQLNIGLQGVEAPRNSLESPESAMDIAPSSSSSSSVKAKSNFNIPMGGIQIKTKRSRLSDQDLSSEYSSSPSTKTPNLVARLMGLDLLPEYSSPRPSSSSTPVNSHNHSRSLPATPRISTASRGSTDNDYHHRLSLQIDKENCNSYKRHEHESLQMKMARRRSELLLHRADDEHTNQYAKQIANQVRERISRRLGTDITNTVSHSPTTRNKDQRRDSNLVLLKPKKPTSSPLMTQTPAPAPEIKRKQDDTNTTVPFSSSPKLRLLDIKSNLSKPTSNSQSSPFKFVGSKPETRPVLHQKPLMKQEKPVKDQKIQRITSERYELRLKNVRQQDDAFVSKFCKKSTPLPNHVENVKNTTKFLSFKKEMTSSSSTRPPQKKVSLVSMTQLPSSLNLSYNQNDIRRLKLSDQDSTGTTTSSICPNGGSNFSDHFDYISRILDLCGIHRTTLISVVQWYSPAHPLHPSMFHQLEKLYHPSTTAGRRLMFDLVDELMAELFKPYTNLKPWVCTKTSDSCGMRGSDLINKLYKKIESIPAADCEVLEDIDGLIERDIGGSMRRLWSTAFEAEAEDIVKEIESEIVETLMHEISTVMVAPAGSDKLGSYVSFT